MARLQSGFPTTLLVGKAKRKLMDVEKHQLKILIADSTALIQFFAKKGSRRVLKEKPCDPFHQSHRRVRSLWPIRVIPLTRPVAIEVSHQKEKHSILCLHNFGSEDLTTT